MSSASQISPGLGRRMARCPLPEILRHCHRARGIGWCAATMLRHPAAVETATRALDHLDAGSGKHAAGQWCLRWRRQRCGSAHRGARQPASIAAGKTGSGGKGQLGWAFKVEDSRPSSPHVRSGDRPSRLAWSGVSGGSPSLPRRLHTADAVGQPISALRAGQDSGGTPGTYPFPQPGLSRRSWVPTLVVSVAGQQPATASHPLSQDTRSSGASPQEL